MEWYHAMSIILGNAAVFLPMFFWLRTESNSDRREHAIDRREILLIMREMKDEMKDFHGRLCAIEERNRK